MHIALVEEMKRTNALDDSELESDDEMLATAMYGQKHSKWLPRSLNLEVFTVPHVNPLDSTGFLWILRDSCGLQWTPNPIDLYGTFYIFWELDWTGVLSESTGIPVLLESCGLESTGLKGNPREFMGLKEIYGHPQDSRGIHRTHREN